MLSDKSLEPRLFRHYIKEQVKNSCFTDAGIIGSKAFASDVLDQVKHLLGSKDERRFTPVGGIEGVYSMKRLSEAL